MPEKGNAPTRVEATHQTRLPGEEMMQAVPFTPRCWHHDTVADKRGHKTLFCVCLWRMEQLTKASRHQHLLTPSLISAQCTNVYVSVDKCLQATFPCTGDTLRPPSLVFYPKPHHTPSWWSQPVTLLPSECGRVTHGSRTANRCHSGAQKNLSRESARRSADPLIAVFVSQFQKGCYGYVRCSQEKSCRQTHRHSLYCLGDFSVSLKLFQ